MQDLNEEDIGRESWADHVVSMKTKKRTSALREWNPRNGRDAKPSDVQVVSETSN